MPSESENKESKIKVRDEFISIIYNKKNDSPKYFEVKKSKILFFVIGLPSITLIALTLGAIGLVHTSPFRLIDTYKQDSLAREALSKAKTLQEVVNKKEAENTELTKKLAESEEKLKPTSPEASKTECPKAPVCPTVAPSGTVSSIGLSTLSLFRPIQGQRDRTRPATLNLSGFKVVSGRDSTNFQFNIVPASNGEGKLSGHIIVIMKSDQAITVYPLSALSGPGTQISYSTGESFSTQRFRPVDASFIKPKKSGNYIFTVYVFARNGDLLHYQSVTMPVKI